MVNPCIYLIHTTKGLTVTGAIMVSEKKKLNINILNDKIRKDRTDRNITKTVKKF